MKKNDLFVIGIVVALPEELPTLTAKKIPKGKCDFISDTILVACSGAGGKNAKQAAELLISQGATRLMSWGCAAALSSELKSGDLTLADSLLDAHQVQININSAWHAHVKSLLTNSLSVHTGTLLESLEIVASRTQKKQLHTVTNAIVLDMESVAVAKVSQQHILPFLAIRAIADPVTMDLPKAVAYSMNSEGEVVLPRLLNYLLFHPSELPALIKLGLHFHAAKKTLKHVATQLDTIINI